MLRLETERLDLRPIDERDKELYCRIYMDAELMRYVGAPLTRKAALVGFGKVCRFNQDAEFRYRCWIMVERESSDEVGLVALMGSGNRAEFGVMILPSWQGRGVAPEVVPRLVDYAFEECDVEEAFTRHQLGNRAGAAVMQKLGFELVDVEANKADWRSWRKSRAQWIATRLYL
jgi:[ribosomal protein S5]-alanine N-acetyltransferase